MTIRERRLAVAVGVIVGGFGLYSAQQRFLARPLVERDATRDRLQSQLDEQDSRLRKIRRDVARLEPLQKQSLPADRQLARSLYQDWLVAAVNRVGFETPNVDSGAISSRPGLNDRLAFTIRAQGDLSQLTRFLYDFYRTAFLHQITRLTMSPVSGSSRLELSMSIEALVLPGAARRTRLVENRSERLKHDSLADYQPLVERNVFGEGGARLFDPADHAFLTAILDVGGQAEAWFDLRSTGQLIKLRIGDPLEVGDFRGTILRIDELDLIVESDDDRWLLTLGESLAQATALPPEL